MTPEKLKVLLSQREGTQIEFKFSKESLSRLVYESIYAFLNRRGGHVILGADNNRQIVGINPAKVQSQLNILAKDMKNPQLFRPHCTPTVAINSRPKNGGCIIWSENYFENVSQ